MASIELMVAGGVVGLGLLVLAARRFVVPLMGHWSTEAENSRDAAGAKGARAPSANTAFVLQSAAPTGARRPTPPSPHSAQEPDAETAALIDRVFADVLHGTPLDTLAKDLCDNLVARHGLSLAWIGTLRPGGELMVVGKAGPMAQTLPTTPEVLTGSAAAEASRPSPQAEGDGPVAQALHGGHPVVVLAEDTAASASAHASGSGSASPDEDAADPGTPISDEPAPAAWVRALGPTSLLAMPLMMEEERPLGALVMALPPDHASVSQVQAAVTPLAHSLGMALPAFLDQARHRLQAIAMNAVGDAIIITDVKGRVEWVNNAYVRMSGYRAGEVVGKIPSLMQQPPATKSSPPVAPPSNDDPTSDHLSPFFTNPDQSQEHMWTAILAGRVWRGEVTERRKDGRSYVVNLVVTPIKNAAGAITHVVAVLEDVTARKKAEERIRYLANYDTLTRLPNRILFRDRLDQAVLQARRVGGDLAVLFVDLDHFSRVNDTLGHAVGDLFLMTIASRINAAAGQADTVARIGGDEFALILTNNATPDGVTALARHLIETIRTPLDLGEHEVRVGANVGISLYPQDGIDSETLVKNADLAMYRAIRSEDESCLFFSKEMNIEASARLGLEGDLRRALLAEDELDIHFQLQYSMRDGKPSGAEALVRWTHPRHGRISPARIIAVAEDSGLIHQLGDWVLRKSLEEYARWRALGCAPLSIAVNISAVQFRQQGLVNRVLELLKATGVPHQDLELELTESMLMQDASQAVEILDAFSKTGIKLAIDDFGTGYSSLSYLKRFRVDRLKVDQSFVRNVTEDPNDAVIARAIINLGHSLGLEVIAEGVETDAQYAYLKNEGCDFVQGFLLARPQPAEVVVASLMNEEGEDGAAARAALRS